MLNVKAIRWSLICWVMMMVYTLFGCTVISLYKPVSHTMWDRSKVLNLAQLHYKVELCHLWCLLQTYMYLNCHFLFTNFNFCIGVYRLYCFTNYKCISAVCPIKKHMQKAVGSSSEVIRTNIHRNPWSWHVILAYKGIHDHKMIWDGNCLNLDLVTGLKLVCNVIMLLMYRSYDQYICKR